MKTNQYLTVNQMAIRICNREDNHYYKQQMIRDILNMYMEEIYEALLDGEKVQLTRIGTLIPEVKIHDGQYTMPTCNKTEGNPPPYAKIRFHENYYVREAICRKLIQNIKKKIFGLKKVRFNEKDMKVLKETGHVPEDAQVQEVNYEED